MPAKMKVMLEQIYNGEVELDGMRLSDVGGWGLLKAGHQCSKPSPVFPRME